MISKSAARYCKDPLSRIQNYSEAAADQKRIWHLHHKREFQDDGDGIRIVESVTLRRRGLYYGRPSAELVFLTPAVHQWIHTLIRKTPRCLRYLVKPLIKRAYGLGRLENE